VVKLRPRSRHRLRFQLAYQNAEPDKPNFVTPPTLGLGVPNQQVRVDVLKAGAPVRSVQRRHVLDRVFRTESGDPDVRAYRAVKANLTPFAGRKIRLRFAVVVNLAPIRVGIDAVKIKTKND